MEGHHGNSHEKKHGSSEGFMEKHRSWLNGNLKEALTIEALGTIGGGALLAAAGITFPIWMLAAMAAPFTYAYMVGKGGDKKKGKGHGHAHAH
jgi:hypothetical protein